MQNFCEIIRTIYSNSERSEQFLVKLNKYEKVPNFIQLSQNLRSDCLLISVYLPVFALCAHKFILFWCAEQFYEHIMQKLVKTQKSTNNSMSIFGLIEENTELPHIHSAVRDF